jgi:enamine deaminase RidA (YjgF/YER057c/UK114 family)
MADELSQEKQNEIEQALSKAYRAQPSTRIPMVDRDKQYVSVDAKDLKQALDAGGQIVSPADFKRAENEAKYGGLSGMILANQLGAARGATMGLSDQAIVGLAKEYGGEETAQKAREYLTNLAEANPISNELSKLGGFAGTILATGGMLGGLTKGAGLLARGAQAIESAEGLGGIAARLGTTIVKEAAINSLYETGEGISEAALGDHELTAESLLAHAKHGAVMGALFGAGFGTLGEGYRAIKGARAAEQLVKQTAEATAKRTAEELATKELSTESAEQMAKLAKEQFGAVSDDFVKVAKQAHAEESLTDKLANKMISGRYGGTEDEAVARKIWDQRNTAFRKADEVVEEAGIKMVNDINDMLKATKVVDQASWGAAKVEQMARLVDPNNVRIAQEASEDIGNLGWKTVSELQALQTKGGAEMFVNEATKIVRNYQEELAIIAKREKPEHQVAKFFETTDKFKRDMDAIAHKGHSEAHEYVRKELLGNLRPMLEDGAIWGEKAGLAQAEMNAAKKAQLDASDMFESALLKDLDPKSKYGKWVANPERVKPFMTKMTNWERSLKEDFVGQYMDTTDHMLDTVKKHYQLDSAALKEIDTAKKAIQQMRTNFKETGSKVQTINQFKALKRQEAEIGESSLLRKVPVVGYLYDYFAKPMTTLERLSRAKDAAERIQSRISKGSEGFFNGKDIKRAAGKKTLMSSDDVLEHMNQVDMMARDLEGTTNKITEGYSHIGEFAPNTSSALSQTTLRAITYLAANKPNVLVNSSIVPGKDKPFISEQDRQEYEDRLDAIQDPMSIIDDLEERGATSKTMVDTVKAVYPKLYQQIETEWMKAAQTQKKEIPYAKKVQMSVLFGVPYDTTMSPEFLDALQHVQHPEQAGMQPGQPAQAANPQAAPAPKKRAAVKQPSKGLNYATINDNLLKRDRGKR